jgi:hypothetical protein
MFLKDKYKFKKQGTEFGFWDKKVADCLMWRLLLAVLLQLKTGTEVPASPSHQ